MSFNWKAVRECETDEESFYRLIGEMLHRTATPRDLIELRDFLLRHNPGSDAWVSLGEALHITTHGADPGFRLWTAWARSLRGEDFDLAQHARRWKNFGAGVSLDEETAADDKPHRGDSVARDADIPASIDTDALDTPTGLTGPTDIFQVQLRTPENRGRGTRTGDLVRDTAIIGKPSSAIRSLIPRGPRAVKLFGRVFEEVMLTDFVALLRRGVLPAAEVEHEGRFIPLLLHPDFEPLAVALRQEAFRSLERSLDRVGDRGGDDESQSGSGPFRHPPQP